MRTSVTVIEAARSHDLTVLETLKEELGIKRTNREHDDHLRRTIRAATGTINQACGRPFGLETVRQRFILGDCERVNALVLQRRPVVSPIASVTLGDDNILDADDFDLFNPDRGLLARPKGACWYGGTISVVYSGGYVLLDHLPDAIEQACLRLASDYYRAAGRDSAVRSVDIPDVESVTYAVADAGGTSTLPPDVRELLRPYLRVI